MNGNILNRFSVNPVNIDMPRSEFSMDHSVMFSADVGEVIPILCKPVLPGDTWSINTSKVIRLQPLVAPIMSNLYQDTYFFFVPNRLIWDHFVNFMGENTSTAWTPQVTYTIPQIEIPSGGFDTGTIADYLGVPPGVGAGREINALPFRAYACVVNEWFRDENLMNPVHLYVGDSTITGSNGSDQVTDIEKGGKPFIACKYFDLFTACLPEPQKSANPVTFNLAGTAPVFASANKTGIVGQQYSNTAYPIDYAYYDQGADLWKAANNLSTSPHNMYIGADGSPHWHTSSITAGASDKVLTIDNLWADMSSVTQFNVNELRQAFALQRYFEALARSGSRYIEQVQAFFGVTSSDYRFMRPEYLGGNRVSVNVSQVENVSNTSTNVTPIGSVAGLSVTGDYNSDCTKSFSEHGYLIGLSVMRYNHLYQQSIDKDFLKTELTDIYNPKWASIGEQPVMLDELYFGGANQADTVFGYNEAWYEYRFAPNRICSELRSTYSSPLDMWHLGDYYTSAPSLSASWIREDKAPLDRCLAVTSSVSNQYIADYYFDINVARRMPMYSIPGLIDHH